MADAIEEVKQEAAAGTHLLAMFGLSAGVRASLGHVSVRVPGQADRFVVKGRGYRTDALPAIRPAIAAANPIHGLTPASPH